jgi:hypothetical protein
MIFNIVNSEDLSFDKFASLSNITIEDASERMAEITIEDIICENYVAMKTQFDSEFLKRLDESYHGKVFLPKLNQSGIVKYTLANVTEAIKASQPNYAKNRNSQLLLLPKEPTRRSPDFVSKNKAIIEWININNPNKEETKLDYYARYIKNGSSIAQGSFTKIMKQLGYQEVKSGRKCYWSQNNDDAGGW